MHIAPDLKGPTIFGNGVVVMVIVLVVMVKVIVVVLLEAKKIRECFEADKQENSMQCNKKSCDKKALRGSNLVEGIGKKSSLKKLHISKDMKDVRQPDHLSHPLLV